MGEQSATAEDLIISNLQTQVRELKAELEGAKTEANALRRERDQARKGLDAEAVGYIRRCAISEEREACCEDVRAALTTGLLTPGQVALAIAAIRARGAK